jgi:hypothetical protein
LSTFGTRSHVHRVPLAACGSSIDAKREAIAAPVDRAGELTRAREQRADAGLRLDDHLLLRGVEPIPAPESAVAGEGGRCVRDWRLLSERRTLRTAARDELEHMAGRIDDQEPARIGHASGLCRARALLVDDERPRANEIAHRSPGLPLVRRASVIRRSV